VLVGGSSEGRWCRRWPRWRSSGSGTSEIGRSSARTPARTGRSGRSPLLLRRPAPYASSLCAPFLAWPLPTGRVSRRAPSFRQHEGTRQSARSRTTQKVNLCVLPLRDPPPLPEDQAPASRSAPATRNGSEATTGAAYNSMAPISEVRLVGSPRSTMWTTVGKPVQSSSAGASGGM